MAPIDRSTNEVIWAAIPLAVIVGVQVLWLIWASGDHFSRPDATADSEFLSLQAALIAAIVLLVSAYHRKRWGIMTLGFLVAIGVLSFEFLFGLPLSLYRCAEWLEAARAAGTSNGW